MQDRCFAQVLKLALRRLMSEVKVVHPSFITEVAMPACTGLPTKKLFSMPLFLWYDFFSCPQNPQCQEEEGDLQSAIDNIPGYIARCAFFFVLCPVIASHALSRLFTQYTWADACSRAEQSFCADPEPRILRPQPSTRLHLKASRRGTPLLGSLRDEKGTFKKKSLKTAIAGRRNTSPQPKQQPERKTFKPT